MNKISTLICDRSEKTKNGSDKVVALICACTLQQVVDILAEHPTWYCAEI